MNTKYRFVLVVLAIASMALGACTGVARTPSAAVKVETVPVAYTGVIENMVGDQWVVNGQAITVKPAVIHDGPFNIGDTVKIEVAVNQDGSFTVTRVELPDQSELTELPSFGDDNSNDDNANDDNSNDDNANDDDSDDDNVNDDDSDDDNVNDDDSDDDNVNDDDSDDDNANDDNGDDEDDEDSSGGDEDSGGDDDSGSDDDSGGSDDD